MAGEITLVWAAAGRQRSVVAIDGLPVFAKSVSGFYNCTADLRSLSFCRSLGAAEE